ncbi:MAG TPA: hypothetical protein VLW17_00545 [Thermoanaerobaculaceae bacterium]|nr:hypothetical protein [Thermoanaerobaculaceae bacterium]
MKVSRMVSDVLTVAVLSVAIAGAASAATYVLPVVVSGVPGLNGSFWDSEVRILLLSPQPDIVVRRVWVALAGGGFVDNPTTAPTWSFPPSPPPAQPRMIVLKGSELLQGVAATHAAVGLEIPGAVAVYLHNVNGRGGQDGPLLGNGQLIQSSSSPFAGPVTIPWATAGSAKFRMSVGWVNPSPAPLTLRVFTSKLSTAYSGPYTQDPRYWLDSIALQPLVVTLPPWGWRQVDDIFSKLVWCNDLNGCVGADDDGLHFLEVEPNDLQAPYFAYASMIYSPLNDPEFVSVIPGSVGGAPRSSVPCPPYCSVP